MHSESKSTKRRFAGSYIVSLLSITLVLFVLGIYAFVMVYTDRLLNYVKENIGFEIVIKSNTKESSILSLKEELCKKDYIKSVEYISKEDATNRMKEDLGEDFLQWLGDVENPLLPSLDLRFAADYANSDSMAMVEKWVGTKTIVKEVIYQKTLTNTINDNINKIKVILFGVSLILLLIAITLISHTIRLSIYSKRFSVRTMQLVGATESFVMKPFVKTFMIQGAIAAIIALTFITITLYSIQEHLPEMNMSQGNCIMTVYISVIVLSLVITFLSTIFSMRKYLNADIDKFYM
ncbi:MAG: permease-like cell division protein FtsX [Bacteroidales bacterium]|nr:permease-like cell division protein FtsX [Bacteroidales bacterium]